GRGATHPPRSCRRGTSVRGGPGQRLATPYRNLANFRGTGRKHGICTSFRTRCAPGQRGRGQGHGRHRLRSDAGQGRRPWPRPQRRSAPTGGCTGRHPYSRGGNQQGPARTCPATSAGHHGRPPHGLPFGGMAHRTRPTLGRHRGRVPVRVGGECGRRGGGTHRSHRARRCAGQLAQPLLTTTHPTTHQRPGGGDHDLLPHLAG